MNINPAPSIGLSHLAKAYLEKSADLMPFFNGDYTQTADFKNINPQKSPEHRQKLVEVLKKQNLSFGNNSPKALQNIDALLQEDSLVVITGQQVSLFMGAAYTLYKTLTTIQLAKQLSVDLGKKVVPVFWLETEDHDLAEANHVHFFKGNDLVELKYTGHESPETGNLGSVGKIRFTQQIEEVLAELDELLPPTEFKPQLMEVVRTAYATGKNFTEAFAALMIALLPDEGMVLACAYNKELKALGLPLFEKALTDYENADAILQNTSKQLVEKGFHAQVNPRPTNVFYMDKSGRYALEPQEKGFKLRGRTETFEDIQALSYPRFSSNVVLRPLMQDYLFPTVAYVAGPGEVAYFAQLKDLYTWAELEMPIIYPRASATVIEARIAKIMEKESLDLTDAAAEIENLFKQKVLAKSDKNIEATFVEIKENLSKLGLDIGDLSAQVDASLIKSAEALKANWLNETDKLEKKLVAAEKRNNEQLRSQLERVQSSLFPQGVGQERLISPLYFINKFGFNFVKELLESLPLNTQQHLEIQV